MARAEHGLRIGLVARERRIVGAQLLDHRRTQVFVDGLRVETGGQRGLDLGVAGLEIGALAVRDDQRAVGVLQALFRRAPAFGDDEFMLVAIVLRLALGDFDTHTKIVQLAVDRRALAVGHIVGQARLGREIGVGERLRERERFLPRAPLDLDVDDVIALAALHRHRLCEFLGGGQATNLGGRRRGARDRAHDLEQRPDQARRLVGEALFVDDLEQHDLRGHQAHLAFDQRRIGVLRHGRGVDAGRHALARVEQQRHCRRIGLRRDQGIGESEAEREREAGHEQTQAREDRARHFADIHRRRAITAGRSVRPVERSITFSPQGHTNLTLSLVAPGSRPRGQPIAESVKVYGYELLATPGAPAKLDLSKIRRLGAHGLGLSRRAARFSKAPSIAARICFGRNWSSNGSGRAGKRAPFARLPGRPRYQL